VSLAALFNTYYSQLGDQGKSVMEPFRKLWPSSKKTDFQWFATRVRKDLNTGVQVVRQLYQAAVKVKPQIAAMLSPLNDPKYRHRSWLIRPLGPAEQDQFQNLFNSCDRLIDIANDLMARTSTTSEYAQPSDFASAPSQPFVPQVRAPPICASKPITFGSTKFVDAPLAQVKRFLAQNVASVEAMTLFKKGNGAQPFSFPLIMKNVAKANKVLLPQGYKRSPGIDAATWAQAFGDQRLFTAYLFAVFLFIEILQMRQKGVIMVDIQQPCLADLNAVSGSLLTMLGYTKTKGLTNRNRVVKLTIDALRVTASQMNFGNGGQFWQTLQRESEVQKNVILEPVVGKDNAPLAVKDIRARAASQLRQRLGVEVRVSNLFG
jgi:hypothetical protein